MQTVSRATRRATLQQVDVEDLNNLERLLLSQAVHEFGADAWSTIADLLSKHPMLSTRPKAFFNPHSCLTIYNHLLDEAHLERSAENKAKHAPTNLALAQRHYVARVQELRDLITEQENKFKTIAAEIDEIRSGAWDEKLLSRANGDSPLVPEKGEPKSNDEKAGLPQSTSTEDTFGSELSGVTELGSPPSQPKPNLEESEGDAVEINGESREDSEADIEVLPEDVQIPGVTDEQTSETADHSKEQDSTELAQEDNANSKAETPEIEEISPIPETRSQRRRSRAQSEQALVAGGVREEEEASSGEEPLHKTRSHRKPASSSSARAANSRRGSLRKTPVVIDEEDRNSVDSPGPEDDDAPFPSPETAAFKRRDAKRKAPSESVDVSRDKKRAREESEPAEDDEQGNSRRRRERASQSEDLLAVKRFQNVITMLHGQISQHRNGNIFHNPIKNSEAPDYREIIKRPMDLKTIKTRIKDGLISNSLDFQRDIYLMFANALMYNRPGSDIYTMTKDMMAESEGFIKTFRQTEGFVRGSQRN